ncbi:arginine deiminase [Rhodohalobacter sp. 8-1]|uniref:arginine deiminase n=1 Tax=Rhodohalobacter sp. 8-1 TaxID=3131972 RepID=UPI0030EB1490
MKIHIPSETGRLKKVIVHTPGHEVSLVNPELKDELLFDDIIFEEDAREEHLDMLDLFKAAMPEDGEILEIMDLARECLQDADIRRGFVNTLVRELPYENLAAVQKDLQKLSADELLRFVVEGSISPSHHFTLHPAPNLLFTRDLAAVVNDTVILSKAAKRARARESLLMELILKNSDTFSDVKNRIIYTDRSQSIEGGDVLVASDKVVLIGMSQRTTFSGMMGVAGQLLSGNVEHVLAVDIPKQRSSMHLDTIFTFSDENECVVFPPAIEEQTDNVVELSKDGDLIVSKKHSSLKNALETLMETEFTFIRCGGDNRTTQFREQWTDGANVFALAPGVIVGYERNTKTFEALSEHGYKIMDQFDFVDEYEDKQFDYKKSGKIAISFQGHELCRGRGGARCMTLPILRN